MPRISPAYNIPPRVGPTLFLVITFRHALRLFTYFTDITVNVTTRLKPGNTLHVRGNSTKPIKDKIVLLIRLA